MHHTRPEQAESQEQDHAAISEPAMSVWATVLLRTSFDSTTAEVLIPNSEFEAYEGDNTTAGHLAEAVGAKAASMNPNLQFVGAALVYDYNPTTAASEDLAFRASAHLHLEDNALEDNVMLRSHQDQQGNVVGKFFVLVTAEQRTTSRQKVLAQAEKRLFTSDAERWQSIQQQVDTAVQAVELRLPQVFRLPTDHQFSAKVNARNIPCYPGMPSRPYLLMEGLAPRLRDGDNIIDVEPIRLISEQEKRTLYYRMQRRAVLLGASGAGKTQMIYEKLAEEYGLLFVADIGGNIGCRDFEDAVAHLDDTVWVKQQPDTECMDAQQRILDDNLTFAKQHFYAVVLARLLILRSLLQHHAEHMCPALWIWIQQFPHHMFQPHAQLADLFRTLWQRCQKLPVPFLMDKCFEMCSAINDSFRLPAFVDEAQTLLQKLPEGFSSSFDPFDPIFHHFRFSAVVKSLDGVCAAALMVGTGIRMAAAAAPDIPMAIGGKPGVSLDEIRALRQTHLTPEQCKEYILKYLDNIEPDDLDTICQTLQGRPQFTERFISSCIEHCGSNTVRQLFESYVKIQVTGEPLSNEDPLHATKSSIYRSISALHSSLGASEDREARHLISALKSLALRCAITGQQQFSDGTDLKLIECGMGNVCRANGKLAVSIREPLVVRAACNFFGLQPFREQRISGIDEEIELANDNPTTHHVFDEDFFRQMDGLRCIHEQKRGITTDSEADASPSPQKRSQPTQDTLSRSAKARM